MTGCGGVASYYGPCGGVDCASCYPVSQFPDDEDVAPEPVGYRCIAKPWAGSTTLWPSVRTFLAAMRVCHGKAPSLYPLFDGRTSGYYGYEEQRFILESVYAEVEDEPTEEMTVPLG